MPQANATPPRWRDRMFQMRLPVFVCVVPGIALVCWAWTYNARNRDVGQAILSRAMDDLRFSPDVIQRRGSAYQLDSVPAGRLADAVNALLAGLRDPDASVRMASARSLATSILSYYTQTKGEAPADRDRATLALVSALRDPDPSVRIAATGALEMLIHSDVVTGLGKVKQAVDPAVVRKPLLAMLEDTNTDAVRAAYRALAELKIAPQFSMTALERLVANGDARSRAEAVRWMAEELSRNRRPADRLLALLDDPAELVRAAAISSLGRSWLKDPRVVRAFVERLGRPRGSDRSELLKGLASINPLPDEAVAPLARAIEDMVREAEYLGPPMADLMCAAEAIGHASPSAARVAIPAVSAVAGTALNTGRGVHLAKIAIGIDPTSREAGVLARLASNRLLESPHSNEIVDLIDVIQAVDGSLLDGATSAFLANLSSDDPSLVTNACTALARIGPAAKEAAGPLSKLASREINPRRIQFVASRALFAVAPGSPEAAEWLLSACDIDDDPDVTPSMSRIFFGMVERMLAAGGLSVESELKRELQSADPDRKARVEKALKAAAKWLNFGLDAEATPVLPPPPR